MIAFSFDYSDYGLLIESLLTRKDICKNMLKGQSRKSAIYKMYSNEIKHIDSLLTRMKDYE